MRAVCISDKYCPYKTDTGYCGHSGNWCYLEWGDRYNVDAVPVVHAHWIYCKLGNGKDGRKCSDCLHTQEITGLLNYCPICGARMDEVTE